jgi:endonuclease YncB( thermonuclease family)
MYEYRSRLERVVDGDTLYLWVDLGFSVWTLADFRMLGINAPEHGTVEGEAATRSLQYLLDRYTWRVEGEAYLLARTHKDQTEKYGRMLVDLWGWKDATAARGDYAAVDVNLNQRMIDNGHAVAYFGGAR